MTSLVIVFSAAAARAQPLLDLSATSFTDTETRRFSSRANIEVATAVMPPGVNPSCPGGAVFETSVALGANAWLEHLIVAQDLGSGTETQPQATWPLTDAADPVLATRLDPATNTCQLPLAGQQQLRRFMTGGNDTHILRVGPEGKDLLVVFAGSESRSVAVGDPPRAKHPNPAVDDPNVVEPPLCAWNLHNVNLATRSTDCGANWSQLELVVHKGHPDPENGPWANDCGNVDQQILHRDPFAADHPVYLLGGTGDGCNGGVGRSVLFRSTDHGQSWQPGGKLLLTASPEQSAILYTPSLTTTPSGRLIAFGCHGTRPVALVSTDRGANWQRIPDQALPDCSAVNGAAQSEMLHSWSPTYASAAWVGTSADGKWEAILLLYAAAAGSSPERNAMQLAVAYLLASPGAAAGATTQEVTFPFGIKIEIPVLGNIGQQIVDAVQAGAFPLELVLPSTAQASVLRAQLIEPAALPTAGQERPILLAWEEVEPASGPADTTNARTLYRVVTGVRTLGVARALSRKAGAAADFSVQWPLGGGGVPASNRWAGEFDRGSWYPEAGADRFLVPWSQVDADDSWTRSHYNVVKVPPLPHLAFQHATPVTKVARAPAAIAGAAGTVQLFAATVAGAVQSLQLLNGAAQGSWTPHGGTILGSPAVASRGAGAVDVFGTGQNQQVWHLSLVGGKVERDWNDLGDLKVAGSPAATSVGPGKVLVVARRQSDNRVLAKRWNGSSWSVWEPLGNGTVVGPLAAVAWAAGRLDVFGRGGNGHLWHYSEQDGKPIIGGGAWEDLGGAISASGETLAAASTGVDKIDVWAVSDDLFRGLVYLPYRAKWGEWRSVGGATPRAPTAARTAAGVEVFVPGLDDNLWRAVMPN